MIVKLKIRTTWKILGKICLKTFRDFLNMWSTIKGETGSDIEKRGETATEGRGLKFWTWEVSPVSLS